MAVKKAKEQQIEIQPINLGRARFRLIGTAPLIMHRFGAKAWKELTYPTSKIKKNTAALEASLKHDPLTEYRECMYVNRNPSEPTFVHFPARAFGQAMASAALDLPGASRSAIQRLVNVSSMQVNVWGTPMLGMDMVRSSDIARTPDVRTRSYFPEWCCEIEVAYIKSLIGQTEVFNLLAAAGCMIGIGDYRRQKGGNFGAFEIVETDDKHFAEIQKQGRKVQAAAWATPDFFNEESAEHYRWFNEELERREKSAPSADISEPILEARSLIETANALKRVPKRVPRRKSLLEKRAPIAAKANAKGKSKSNSRHAGR